MLKEVVAELAPLAKEHHIDMRLEVTHRFSLCADRYFLRRALLYVVHNAIKFSPQGSQILLKATVVASEILPTAHRSGLPPQCGLITVQDQGIGIPKDFIEKIFQPFLQVDASDSRSHPGLGLELAICHQIIQRHGGCIWVASVLGRGSTFYIALPLASECL
jgi:two-component system sensor histidine kinase VicK